MQDTTNKVTNEKKPIVSFIIPLYNVPVNMLIECINSILSLSLRDSESEIIIVDDGSEQSPLTSLGKLTDKVVYIRQVNKGVSVARNTGMRMAQGEFIQFIDGDDILLRAPYEHVIDLVRFQQPDMVMFDFTDKRQPSVRYDDMEPLAGNELMRRENIHGAVWSYIVRRSLIGELQFTPGVRYGEDEEFTPQLLLRAKRVFRTTAKAYHYRTRDTSATNAHDSRSILSRLNDALKVIVRLKSLSAHLQADDHVAMERRIAQLTMDYIYNVIVLTRNRHYLDRKLSYLTGQGLFPLPDRKYTTKYSWFRRMTQSEIGLTLLMSTLPLINRER